MPWHRCYAWVQLQSSSSFHFALSWWNLTWTLNSIRRLDRADLSMSDESECGQTSGRYLIFSFGERNVPKTRSLFVLPSLINEQPPGDFQFPSFFGRFSPTTSTQLGTSMYDDDDEEEEEEEGDERQQSMTVKDDEYISDMTEHRKLENEDELFSSKVFLWWFDVCYTSSSYNAGLIRLSYKHCDSKHRNTIDLLYWSALLRWVVVWQSFSRRVV